MKNTLIGGSMRGGKTSITELIKGDNTLHGDNIRKELLGTIPPFEQNLLLPKYSRYLKGEFTFEELLKNLTTQDYLRVEQYENGVVYDRGIKQIIEKWIDNSEGGNIIEGVQLLPQKLVETLAGKEDIFNVIYLVKTDLDRVLGFIDDSLDNGNNSGVSKDFVSGSLQAPLTKDRTLRVTFADLIVAYGKEVSYAAKENGFDVIETSGDKKVWVEEFKRKIQG